MSFAREKRLLLGFLALLVPLPLPFNEPQPYGVVGWPFVLTYLLAVLFFLHRANQDPATWLRPWMLNLLGLAYLPFLFLDLSTFSRGHLVRPMVHVAMFAVVVKLFSLNRERDKWHAAIGIYFIFLTAMATSAHPAIVLYLVAFLVLSLLLLTRFAFFHVVAGYWRGESRSVELSMTSFLAASTLVAVVLAIPLFTFLPRLRSPYILGRGTGTGTIMYSTGFSDEVNLDVIGTIRTNRSVAVRLQFEDSLPPPADLRLKGATYEAYESGMWRRSAPQRSLRPLTSNVFRLAPGRLARKVKMWLRPLNARSLIVPIQAVTFAPELRHATVEMDRGGALFLPVTPAESLHYTVGMALEPVQSATVPKRGAGFEPALDPTGVTPRIARLAAAVAEEGSAAVRARRLEAYLVRGYEYTLDFVGRKADTPIEDFLFRYKSGHCEYFASSLVLMLRSQGIPARLVTGFLGAEYNPLEGYYIVRQSNAHAWVEAYLDDGWQILDPTPPAGRPSLSPESLRLLISQAYDYLMFRWDRYVLSYGVYDQMGFFFRLRRLWGSFWQQFLRPKSEAPGPGLEPTQFEEEEVMDVAPPPAWSPQVPVVLVVLLVLLLVLWIVVWRARLPPISATKAYFRLRRRAARFGLEVNDAVAPLTLRSRVVQRFPHAAVPTSRLVQLYLRESFGGETLSEPERREIEEVFDRAAKAFKKAS